jgi:uncharacterized protein (TIGR03435 family)
MIPGVKAQAVVETADGLYRGTGQVVLAQERVEAGEVLHTTAGAGAMLALADGSRVEMRSQSELSLERADDGVRIRLRTGSIIVNAANQPSGHLYVQTKDMTVSVIGTVFLVNAEDDGSRVAVIEGEVRVREAKTETKLRPGEQVSSSSRLEARPVTEEIAWSRQKDAHLALLQQSAPQNPAQTAGRPAPVTGAADKAGADKPRFEEASIRPCDPDNLPPASPGGRGGGANSFQMTPGRTHVLCMTLATIIRHAYGYGPADLDFLDPGGRDSPLSLNAVYGLGVEDGVRVRRGPDWVRSERYWIDAVADGAADAATMSGPMLRELLERRFQLKAHIEAEQVPAFTLTMARGGLKIKPVESGACTPRPALMPGGPPSRLPPRFFDDVRRGEKPPCGVRALPNGPNIVFVGGEASLTGLAMLLAAHLGGLPVLDKTGNTDKFNFVLEYVVDENTPGALDRFVKLPAPEPADVPRGQTIFAALDEQIGLKLEPARAPRDYIVIDRVERPSPN